eukprot:CAMPEP_0197527808 /NCGR_PEP_ID=MMETSP1318-20131121/22835_1 /TAXON_ID=552666 /ORGANISM="Partenskyella glossopodia, Strain RCC365" /LENGTH=489 /DNA_ID=CAMNT_0043082629 /DNA_START=95 /DNA_END=1561 /DNA_ORIENTATION=-
MDRGGGKNSAGTNICQSSECVVFWAVMATSLLLLWWMSIRVTGETYGSSIVVAELFAAFLLALANGANDIANAVGTSVGAGALSMTQGLVLGSGLEFSGAILLGALVSKTISKGVIEPGEYSDEPGLFAALMFSVVVGSAVTTLLATFYGYPISATHGIISGLVAVGWYAKGSDCIGWGPLRNTIIMWILSPVAGLVAAFLLQLLCMKINTIDLSYGLGIVILPLLWIFTLTLTFLFLFATGPEAIRFESPFIAMSVSVAAGCMLTGLYYTYKSLVQCCTHTPTTPSVPKVPPNNQNEAELANGDTKNKNNNSEIYPKSEPNPNSDPNPRQVCDDPAESNFVGLLVLSALTVAFAHGANDVGNAVGPLAVMMEVLSEGVVHDVPKVQEWCLALGACGFVVGILTLGKNTVETVGNKIIRLTPSTSYATQMGAAIAVLLSSALGMPVSTSHCLVGSVLGAGLAQSFVARFKGHRGPDINFWILNKIFIGW